MWPTLVKYIYITLNSRSLCSTFYDSYYDEVSNSSNSSLSESELPQMTNVALAASLYTACLATVFGNSLVIAAVFKVQRFLKLFILMFNNSQTDSLNPKLNSKDVFKVGLDLCEINLMLREMLLIKGFKQYKIHLRCSCPSRSSKIVKWKDFPCSIFSLQLTMAGAWLELLIHNT